MGKTVNVSGAFGGNQTSAPKEDSFGYNDLVQKGLEFRLEGTTPTGPLKNITISAVNPNTNIYEFTSAEAWISKHKSGDPNDLDELKGMTFNLAPKEPSHGPKGIHLIFSKTLADKTPIRKFNADVEQITVKLFGTALLGTSGEIITVIRTIEINIT